MAGFHLKEVLLLVIFHNLQACRGAEEESSPPSQISIEYLLLYHHAALNSDIANCMFT